MGLKKKLAMGVATGMLAVGMIGGGTYAYFNDVETTQNTFAAGTLDLAVNPTTIIDVKDIKPGDWMLRTFKLENNGSLDISKVFLTTEYTESVEGFGEHIIVDFLVNPDKLNDVIYSKTLSELKNMSPDAVKNNLDFILGEKRGLKAGDTDNLYVNFRFKENGKDQNAYQGASLELKWTFDAKQTGGVSK